VNRLEIVEGGLYRNGTGGELHAIQQMRYLTHGALLGMQPAFVIGEVWLMESRGDMFGTVPFLVTPDELAAHGYECVAGEARS
jgi:hypothetical protein